MAISFLTGSLILDFLLSSVIIMTLLIAFFLHSYNYWENKNVPFLEPTFPLGNNSKFFTKSSTFGIESKIWYDTMKKKGYKFGGVWTFYRKALVLVDPDYIRDILIKDFVYFADRDVYCDGKNDPQNANLFNIKNDSWKHTRQLLSPTFSSEKIKMMFPMVLTCGHHMVEYLKHISEDEVDIEIEQILAGFTMNTIGCCAFGLECSDFGSKTIFQQMGKTFFHMGWKEVLNIMIVKHFPELSKILGIRLSNRKVTEYFAELIKNTFDYRKSNRITRPDFIQTLIDLMADNRNEKTVFTPDEMIANILLFFSAGVNTSSAMMNFVLYELARHPDIQERTRKEIKKVLKNRNDEITYESIQEMTYLRQVIDETLRLYPPVPTLSRICLQKYKLRDTHITIEKGTPIVISALGLGRDSDYFPDPETFNPDRFAPEKQEKMRSCVYIPFGDGPRGCLGIRFGLMQSSIGLIKILTQFKVSIGKKTQMPLTLDPDTFFLRSTETLYLRLECL